jgi:stage II sporulation protein M
MSYKWWILVAVGVFGIGMVLGLVNPVGTARFLSEDMAALRELSGFISSLPAPLTAVLIFAKNALALLLSFALSPLLFVVPVLALAANGWLLAFVASVIVQEESVGFVLAGLVPHGIIELPAFILGEAAALSFGAMLMLALVKREKRDQLVPGMKRNLRYLLIAVVLLIPAAVIETFVTPLLLT